MPNMIILRGVPASGKSTFRKQMVQDHNYVYVNNDELRVLYPDYKEHDILELSGMLARDYMYQGENIIIDNTNINPRTVERWETIGKEYRYNVEVKEFTVDYLTAVKRDRQRDNPVGKSVIWKMIVDLGQDPIARKSKTAVIFDLDGTLCDISHRRHFVTGEGKKDWKGFYSGISGDIPNKAVDELYMMVDQKYPVIFVSGRPEDYRKVTEEWLDNLGYCYDLLLMRPFNNKDDDTIIKSNIYDKYIEPYYDIVFTVDDRDRVVKMWRDKGLTCFQCAEGNF